MIYFHTLKELNYSHIFNDAINSISSKENGIIILSTNEVRAILAETGVKATTDLFVDNVIITVVPCETFYFLCIDFISCNF